MREPPTPEQLISRLRLQRIEIEQTLRSLEEAGRPVQLDQATQGRLSRMDAIGQQQMAKAGQTHLRIQLMRIDAAIKRHAEQRFGRCCKCGEPIAPARLDADPAAPLCIDCVSQAEHPFR